MAVTKTTIVSVLVVFAITFNQGAARPSGLSGNVLSSSEEGDTRIYMIPTAIKKGLVIIINGTINTNDSTFIVELPSISGKDSCQITYNYITDKEISITPAVGGYEMTEYDLKVTPGSNESPSFSLTLVARVDKQNNDMFGMTFFSGDVGPSSQLICKIDNFDDINQIVIKQGVARVDSLLFEFKSVVLAVQKSDFTL